MVNSAKAVMHDPGRDILRLLFWLPGYAENDKFEVMVSTVFLAPELHGILFLRHLGERDIVEAWALMLDTLDRMAYVQT
jgi:hypothetical protein